MLVSECFFAGDISKAEESLVQRDPYFSVISGRRNNLPCSRWCDLFLGPGDISSKTELASISERMRSRAETL